MEQLMLERNLAFDASEKEEKDEGNKANNESPTTFLLALEDISNTTKYLMRFDCDDNVMPAPSSVENVVYWVYKKRKNNNLP